MRPNTAHSDDVDAQWARVFAKFDAMTPDEKVGTLISAGILTKAGKVHQRYRNVIVPIKPAPQAKTKAK